LSQTRVAIVGAALSDIGRVDHHTPFDLHFQATSRAAADAGLSKDDIDGFCSTGMGALAPVEMAEYLGMRPTYIDSTGVGGSTWEVMVEHAMAAIQAGVAETVCITYGSTTRSDLKKKLRNANLAFGTRGPSQFEAPWGHTLIAKYAMTARRHMEQYGTTIEQLANIAVDTRWNASHNPEAQMRDLITVDDVNDGKYIADPFTKGHCCIRSDGGGAVILTSEERAKDLKGKPVYILGSGEVSNITTMSEWEDFTVSPAAVSGKLAFERAGLTPEDIDVCEFYDAFTSMALLTFEALGFCKPGEAGSFLEGGTMRVGGALPTNTDGGGLSHCHPGMRGIFLLVEAVRQLRGEAPGLQVEGANTACVNGTGGWFSSASTIILGNS
jgi:acetyl-CoA acetyltransferase